MPVMNPRNFPIRKLGDKSQMNGQVYNQPSYAETGGLTGPDKLGKPMFDLETPTKRRSGESGKKAPQ